MALGEGESRALHVMPPAAAGAVRAMREQWDGREKGNNHPSRVLPSLSQPAWCTWDCGGIRHEGLQEINAVNLEF